MYGSTATLTVSYNTGTLNATVANAASGGYYFFDPSDGLEYYRDYAGDSAFTVSITIGTHDYSVTNNIEGGKGQVANLNAPLDGPHPQLSVDVGGYYPGISEDFVSTSNLPLGDLENQSAVDAYMQSLTSATIICQL